MRVGYLITSYRPPAQLIRLLGTLRGAQPQAPLVVHHDRFRSSWPPGLLDPVGDVDVVTSDTPVSWGDFSIVAATWRTLSWMVEHREFDWVIFLSEQDYPITPLDRLERHLIECGADALVDAVRLDLIDDPDLRMDCDRRYNYHYRRLPRPGIMPRLPPRVHRTVANSANYANFVLYKLQRALTFYRFPDGLPLRIGVRTRRSPFSKAFPCWYGSQWMALSHRAARRVVEFVSEHHDYARHFAQTVIPDESATTTIVCNAPDLQVRNEELHHIRFGAGEGHPDVFTFQDLGELISSERFFARKFDIAVDAAVLDALDRHVLTSRDP